MKSLTIEQMESYQCGDGNVADWFCGLWAAGRVLRILAFTNPAACAVAFATDIACTIYGIAVLAS